MNLVTALMPPKKRLPTRRGWNDANTHGQTGFGVKMDRS